VPQSRNSKSKNGIAATPQLRTVIAENRNDLSTISLNFNEIADIFFRKFREGTRWLGSYGLLHYFSQ
jgi:hypothetical protein